MAAIIVALRTTDLSLLVNQTRLLITHRKTAHRSLARVQPSSGRAEPVARDDRTVPLPVALHGHHAWQPELWPWVDRRLRVRP